MPEWSSLSHVRWDCKYHVVFVPKYRKKQVYGKLRRQVAAPGWKYMDFAVGSIGRGKANGKYFAFKAPNGRDWSLIIVTGVKPADVRIEIDDNLSHDQVHVWKSNNREQMQKLQALALKDGIVTLKLDAKSIYTLTTTTGQTKGQPAHSIPAAVAGGHQKDDFSVGYKLYDKPRYWGDLEGTFEIAEHEGRQVLKQVVPQSGYQWHKGTYGEAITLFGGADHVNTFGLKVEMMIQDGYLAVGGMVVRKPQLRFRLNKKGMWSLNVGEVKKDGEIKELDSEAWHVLEMKLVKDADGYRLSCFIDDNEVLNVSFKKKDVPKPMTPFISSSYHPNMLKSVEVVPGL